MPGEMVLIVDDAPLNRKLADLVLRREGFQVQTACDAEEALVLLHGYHPDIMLVDLQMPGMDGLELTRCIKQDPSTRDIVVLALTASTAAEDEREARAAGCVGYIVKPVDTKTLASTVRGYLHGAPAAPAPTVAPVLPGGLPLSDPELESLRRRFLEEGIAQSRQLLESLSGSFEAARAGNLLHRWVGAAGALGYSGVSQSARVVQELIEDPQPDESKLREALTELVYAFSEPPEASWAQLPDSVVQALSGKAIALVAFSEQDAERLCAAMERVGARPRRFDCTDPPDCRPVRDCSIVLVQVSDETLLSPWLSSQSPGSREQPLVLAGGRERIMTLDVTVQSRVREFLIDGWQPEEALLRCSFALSRAPAAASTRSAGSRQETPTRPAGPPQIVLADDDPVVRSVVRGTLVTYGMDCRVASSGSEALEMIRGSCPDAAVLDVNMPGMDGYLVLASLREEGFSIPVILLTARRHENDITRGFTLGADDYIVKPFNNVELVARLKRLLRR